MYSRLGHEHSVFDIVVERVAVADRFEREAAVDASRHQTVYIDLN